MANRSRYARHEIGPMKKEMDLAIEVADKAGKMMMSDFSPAMQSKTKGDGTPVTETDKKINDAVIDMVRSKFPDHNIMGEEGGYLANKSPYCWVFDPIDGTIAYKHGIPTAAFSISLEHEGIPILGVVHDPATNRMLSASVGEGAFMNGTIMNVSKRCEISGSVIGLSYWNGAQFNIAPMNGELVDMGASVLMLGSIVQSGMMVAMGEFEAAVHPSRLPFDSAALRVIITEAKGMVTDINGNDQRYDCKIKGAVMSNGILHAQMLNLLRCKRSKNSYKP